MLSCIACITVTFNPDMLLLGRQLAALPPESPKVIVDNASCGERFLQIEKLVRATPNAQVIRNATNIGLAAGINKGVCYACVTWPQADFALLLDQDSEPRSGSVANLISTFRALAVAGENPGCVGPNLIDGTTGFAHGFHQYTRWRWRRVYPASSSGTPINCANLNGSGTLVPIELFVKLHGLDERLFIDHVDTEWAFLVLSKGYGRWCVPQAVFTHSMGLGGVRFWLFGWRVWPSRSAQRHYFLYRNAVILMHRKYVPLVWKIWAAVKLVITCWITMVIGPDRPSQLLNMWNGLLAGFRNGSHLQCEPGALDKKVK